MRYCICEKCGDIVEIDDSMILSVYPPKYRYVCECGHSGYVFAEGTTPYKSIKIAINDTKLATPCLICGEDVEISGYRATPKICESCKDAIMFLKENKDLFVSMATFNKSRRER